MCHPIPVARALQQAIPNNCTAKTLGPSERLTLGVQALPGNQTITGLAEEAGVSRKFVYQQADIAQTALADAFASADADDKALFHLPVTNNWLQQVALGLALICHSSYRGVHEFCRDVLNVHMAPSTVHNICERRKVIVPSSFTICISRPLSHRFCLRLEAIAPNDGLWWIFRIIGARDGQFAEQKA